MSEVPYCIICTVSYKDTEEICTTHCGHMFHLSCMQEWKRSSSKCPKCEINDAGVDKVLLPFADVIKKNSKLLELTSEVKQSQEKIKELKQQLKRSVTSLLDLQVRNQQNEHNLKELECQKSNDQKDVITLREKNKVLEEKLRTVTLELEKEIRNSTELTVDKLKLQSIINQSNTAKPTGSYRSELSTRSVVVKGLKDAADTEAHVKIILKLARQMKLYYKEADIEEASILTCSHHKRNNISPKSVNLVVRFTSADLMKKFFKNKDKLEANPETKDIKVCEFINFQSNPMAQQLKKNWDNK